MINKLLPGLAIFGLAAGCATAADQDRAAVVTESLSAAGDKPLHDAPAAAQVAQLRTAFKSGTQRSLAYAIYELEDVPSAQGTLKGRAAELDIPSSISGAASEDTVIRHGRVGLTAGDYWLTRNQVSGAEFFGDMSRFHRGQGIPQANLLPEADYISAARKHISKKFASLSNQANLYPYKVWTYMNGSRAQGETTPLVEAYQVAVAFNTTIDGVPVIGSGGKAAVHMTPSGEVIGHESTLRAVKGKKSAVAGADLLSPDEARAQVEARLQARGINLNDFTLSREEFGYFRRGHNSGQKILAPHYAYFYQPVAGVESKKLVEVVPAVKEPTLLALIASDEANENARKQADRASPDPGTAK